MKKALKIIGIIFLAIIIIIVTAILTGYFYLNSKLSQMKQVNIDENNLNVATQVEEKLTGYRNIALFGVDSRDSDLGKGNRSDCIIIASINNDTKEINLVSVYRDTYVDIDGYGLDKITHAYSYGGPELALKTLNKNLDLNIKEFVTVNFDAVADVVDALGGVDIRIEDDEISYLTAGSVPPNPSELLVSEKMAETMKKLEDMCDIVIYDGTPTNLVTDALIISRNVDSTIIVCAYKYTKIDDLERVKRDILNVGGKIAGVVINKMPIAQKEYYASYYYGSSTAVTTTHKKSTRNKVDFAARIRPENQEGSRLYNIEENKNSDE